jgi:ribosomal protein S24E
MQQEPPWLMARFQSNCIFKIYRDPMQRKKYEYEYDLVRYMMQQELP